MGVQGFPGRTHRYVQVPVLFPFGFGLSYTTFAYTGLKVCSRECSACSRACRGGIPRLVVCRPPAHVVYASAQARRDGAGAALAVLVPSWTTPPGEGRG
jgi:hypothetical protein